MTELPTGAERVAILSDIHGNLTALEVVLAHIAAMGITRIFNLGDLVGKGPRSAAVVDRCRDTCEIIVQGNWDDMVAQDEAATQPVLQWHRAQLGAERLRYLASLPASHDFLLSGRRVRLFHASQIGIYHRVHATAERAEHSAMFGNTAFTGFGPEPDMVGYGDIHGAYLLNFEHRTLFNVGSVGNPLDVPLACYAVLEGWFGAASAHPWSLHFVRVPYDIESEVAVAQVSGMPAFDHYANELRTAVYRGRTA
ncbi:metallophosphoesterase family protein [Devosia oryziradicis]|uniref:Metallophosphoesterase family protein n=1 Tax=Devosia oryziradicis TaxID=2801335 RepID=A0ABX7BVJ9_9HYPH|nr:metallophosphoesterase family protein [Devosia oryziradicis]QQR35974.1 metallophosphoesterase family protein [Devosia oryziradicis]